jgi:hypothetical protein
LSCRLSGIAIDDALREAFHDRGLADARLADQHRIVLGTARSTCRCAGFPRRDRCWIDLAVARRLGQVAGTFERVWAFSADEVSAVRPLPRCFDRGVGFCGVTPARSGSGQHHCPFQA